MLILDSTYPEFSPQSRLDNLCNDELDSNKSWDDNVARIYSKRVLLELVKEAVALGGSSAVVAEEFGTILNMVKEPLIPIQRFLLGSLLRLFSPSKRRNILCTIVDACSEEEKRYVRNDIIPRWGDPLLLIQERLEIHRFMTTNYDHEISRLFDDLGFQQIQQVSQQEFTFHGLVEQSRNAEIGHAHDLGSPVMRPGYRTTILDSRNAGELIAFSAEDRAPSGHAIHLHGRAVRRGMSGNITVTERDFQERYLSPDASRDLLDNAVRLAFGANPILFVGSNMGEDDILRPLRQFMSAAPRIGDRICIALVPGKYDIQHCTEEKIALLGRFGVYTIHFGNAGVENTKAFWLPWALAINDRIIKALDVICNKSIDQNIDPEGLHNKIKDLIVYLGEGNLYPRLEDEPSLTRHDKQDTEKRISILRREFITEGPTPQWPLLKTPILLEDIPVVELMSAGTGTNNGMSVRVEVALINSALRFLSTIENQLLNMNADQADELRAHRPAALAYRAALNGAADAMLTTFTCARLLRTRWDWDEWRTEWFKIPRARSTEPSYRPKRWTEGEESGLLVPGYEIIDTHALDLRDEPEKNPKFGRFYGEAPSQAAELLMMALATEPAGQLLERQGRRIILVVTHRGAGKGHFFASI